MGSLSESKERDPWYANWFGEEYLALYPHRDDEEAIAQAAFAADLLGAYATKRPAGYLDLACGTGRHAVALSGALNVVGLDLSPRLLSEAAKRFDTGPSWVRGDMRRLPFRSGAFGAVVNFFTSFGYFDDPKEDVDVLSEVARVLTPGGAFLSDVFNAERVLATFISREEKTIAGQRIKIRRRYDENAGRLEKEIEMGMGDDARTFTERVRVYREADLRRLHESVGFRIQSFFGDFDGSPFDVKRSPRLILLAVREAAR